VAVHGELEVRHSLEDAERTVHGCTSASGGPTSVFRIPTTPAQLLALQRTVGNRAVARMLARQDASTSAAATSSAASVGPAPDTGALTNQQLLDELQRLEQARSTSSSGALAEDRYRALRQERELRLSEGHIWLADADATGLLQTVGDEGGARVEASGQDPRQMRGSCTMPIFSRRQLDRTLQRNGIPQVDLTSRTMASTGQAAGAVPGPSVAPQVLGRYYPFQRPMTPAEQAMVAQRGAVHYTPEGNLPQIAQPDTTVGMRPSTGYRNLADPGARQSSYHFVGEPTAAQYGPNMIGRPPMNEQAVIFIQGADLPTGTLFRPIDGVLAVPGGYRGPALVLGPGQPAPSGNGLAIPVPAGPLSMAEQLRAQGSFSGHPLASGAGSGMIAMVMETGIVLVNTGQFPGGEQLTEAGLTGTAGGLAGGVAEQAAARGIASTTLGQSSSRVFVVLGRGGAGAAGGFIAAPIVELGRMALDDEHQYTATDYTARGTRAAVAGGLSGALAAGATAAAAGSVAPGVGTAIGFVVGVGAYLLIDWLVGDEVEEGVRAVAQ
jgi:hypothetical protein